MTHQAALQAKPASTPHPLSSGLLQRKCESCGQHRVGGGKCGTCQKQKSFLQNENQRDIQIQQKSDSTSAQSGFNHDFSRVPISTTVPRIQPKLRVSQPNDKYEQEADRIAEQVMRMPEPVAQRQIETEEEALQAKPIVSQITPLIQRQSEEEDEEKTIQTKRASSSVPAITRSIQAGIRNLRQSTGQPLSPNTRAFMESRFRHDFSKVRTHTGSEAEQLGHSLNAKAFTLGKDIAFTEGAFDCSSSTGKLLLAHELVHSIQQEGNSTNNKDNTFEIEPSLQEGLIQRKTCDPLIPDCPSGTACLSTGSTFECLPTDEGTFEKLVNRILKETNKKELEELEKELEEFINRNTDSNRLKEFEKIIALWPAFGNQGKKARIIAIVTAPLRTTDLEESQRGRFSEEEGSKTKVGLDQAKNEQIEQVKKKILIESRKKGEPKTEEEAMGIAKDKVFEMCLAFLSDFALKELYADEEEERKTAKLRYESGATERKKTAKNKKKPIHAATLSRLASELRLQGLVGPLHILPWKGSHEKGHHSPEPAVLFDRLSDAGNGWYFFLVNLVSFHTFIIAVHVSSNGGKRRYFEIQGGQSVEKTREELKEWFDRTFDPSVYEPKHKRNVGSRVWQVYFQPTD